MRLLNYLKMIYLKSLFFLNAKEKNRTCIFVNLLKDIKRLSELNGLTCYSNTRTLERIIINKFTDDNSLQVLSTTQQQCKFM